MVHAAVLSRADECERRPDLATELNARLPGRLAAACRPRGIRLVGLSTDLVFGGERALSDERPPPAPLSVYGRTKLEGEEALLAADPRRPWPGWPSWPGAATGPGAPPASPSPGPSERDGRCASSPTSTGRRSTRSRWRRGGAPPRARRGRASSTSAGPSASAASSSACAWHGPWGCPPEGSRPPSRPTTGGRTAARRHLPRLRPRPPGARLEAEGLDRALRASRPDPD